MEENNFCYDYESHSDHKCLEAYTTSELALNALKEMVQEDTEDDVNEDGYVVQPAYYFEVKMNDRQREMWKHHPEAVMLKHSDSDDYIVYYIDSIQLVTE